MVDPVKVTLVIRDKSYPGEIMDVDALLFMGAIFNEEENELLTAGQIENAQALYQKRADKRLEQLKSQGKSDEDLLNEWALYLLNRVNLYADIQNRIAWRITQRFPTIPSSLIEWDGKKGVIRLHIVELLQVLTGLIVPSMEIMKKANEGVAAVEEASTSEAIKTDFPTEEPQPEKALETPPVIPEVVQSDTQALDEEIVQIEAMLEQRLKQRQEQRSATLEAAIVQQRQ